MTMPEGNAELTDRQAVVLRLIFAHHCDHGRPPSMRELGHYLGTGNNGVVCHLAALVRKNYLVCEPNVAHGYRLVGVNWVPEFTGEAGQRLREVIGDD